MSSYDEGYRQGYQDATAIARRDLAAALRTYAIGIGDDTDEPLSDARVRDIFASVFGVKASDDEFGPEPTGQGVRKLLGL